MSNSKKKPIHIEKVEGLDRKAFAEKLADSVADSVIEEINRQRRAQGKPPIPKK